MAGEGSTYFEQTGAPAGAWFDVEAADRACEFIETFCVQSQGEWAGRPLVLAEWQRTIIRDVFGWMRGDGTRQFRTVYVEIPRKNGKALIDQSIALDPTGKTGWGGVSDGLNRFVIKTALSHRFRYVDRGSPAQTDDGIRSTRLERFHSFADLGLHWVSPDAGERLRLEPAFFEKT
jgi:hypothetical protein